MLASVATHDRKEGGYTPASEIGWAPNCWVHHPPESETLESRVEWYYTWREDEPEKGPVYRCGSYLTKVSFRIRLQYEWAACNTSARRVQLCCISKETTRINLQSLV